MKEKNVKEVRHNLIQIQTTVLQLIPRWLKQQLDSVSQFSTEQAKSKHDSASSLPNWPNSAGSILNQHRSGLCPTVNLQRK